MIIDAHLHLPVLSGQGTYEQGRAQLLADMHEDQVDYALVIADNVADSEIGDVLTCVRLFASVPEVFVIGSIDIENQGAVWIAKLERLIASRQIVGMKIFPGHDPIYPTDPRLDPVYDLCQVTQVPMVIHTGWNPGHPEVGKYNDPKHIVAVAKRYPQLKIVIAHYNWPEVEYCYELTHPFANIYYDTSGLADPEVIEASGAEKIQNVLLKTLTHDAGRVLFGTDYAMCSRPDHIRMIEQLPVDRATREMIFWRNAVTVFRLPVSRADSDNNRS